MRSQIVSVSIPNATDTLVLPPNPNRVSLVFGWEPTSGAGALHIAFGQSAKNGLVIAGTNSGGNPYIPFTGDLNLDDTGDTIKLAVHAYADGALHGTLTVLEGMQ